MITAACCLLLKMHKLFKIFPLLVLVLLASCAQIVTPTGGDKDYTAPQITEVYPANKTVHFNRKKISIRFNEFIQLNTPEELIVISPPMEIKPTYLNKGKVLEIRFNAPLAANTTYNINFATAIGDNKENNLLRNFNYSFSTGSFLDSGRVSGSVYHAFTNKPESDITVALYYPDSFTDSTIVKRKPVYLSKTDENGLFLIGSLPNVPFRLIAFKDENKNLKAEKNEDIAYTEDLVNPLDTLQNITLRTFKPDPFLPGKITDTFNRQPDKFVFVTYKMPVPVIKNKAGIPVYVNKIKGNISDTLLVFTKMNPGDTAANFIVNNEFIHVRYKPIFKTDKFSYTVTNQPELTDTIVFRFNNPVIKADTARIMLYQDSTRITPEHLFISPFEYRLAFPWVEKNRYKLLVSDSAFTDLFDQYSIKNQVNFTAKSEKDYGSLLLHVKLPKPVKGQIILQLTDEAEKVIAREFIISSTQDLMISHILPGNYRIKYIYDTNKNGQWDNGDFKARIQPERVGYFNEVLNIKAYWDLEQSILIQ